MPSVLLALKQDFSNFCSIPYFINSCTEEVQVGVIYNTDSNEGDLSPHASQTIYFSNINENKISDRETPVELLSLEPQYGTEPLLISSISIIRHSKHPPVVRHRRIYRIAPVEKTYTFQFIHRWRA